jgi:hypothetical protein
VKVSALCEGDQALSQWLKALCLGLSGLDALVLEQLGSHVAQQ